MTAAPITKQRRYKNPYSIVRAAKRMIDTGHWAQGIWGRTADGESFGEYEMLQPDVLDDRHGGVCKACLEGALALCAADKEAYDKAALLIDKQLPEQYQGRYLLAFNDDSSQADVSEVLEKTLLTK